MSGGGKKRGPEWDHVDVVDADGDNGRDMLRCRFCAKDFYGGATRIRNHLLGERGCGVEVCNKCPEAVKKSTWGKKMRAIGGSICD